MKKLLLLAAAILMVPMAIQAQDVEPTFRGEGALDINAGLGFGTTLTGTGIPISASLMYGYNDNISVGGYLGFAQTKQDFNFFGGTGTWTYTNFIIGARGAYHYPVIEDIDTYGGLMLGYNIASASYDGVGTPASSSVGGLSYSLYLGGRYYFTEKLGAYAELGYGIAYLQFGVTVAM